jgi:hypothetical protein
MRGHSGRKSLGRLTALCVVLTASALAGCRSAPLAPAPHVFAASTREKTREAIVAALIAQQYVADEETTGRIRARLQNNSWSMVVEVRYDDRDVSVNYADSHNLMYEMRQDTPYIHRNYNLRAQELADEIKHQIANIELRTRPMPAAATPPPPPAPAPTTAPN